MPSWTRRLSAGLVSAFFTTAGLALTTPGAAVPSGASPVTHLDSTSVHQNRTIGIVASGFTPRGKLTWQLLDANDGVASTDSGRADDDGTAYRQLTPAPTVAPGAHTLTITDDDTGSVATATIHVLPADEAPPLSVELTTERKPGGTSAVHVSGLPSGSPAQLALGHGGISRLSHVARFHADHDGHSSIPISPGDLDGGERVIFLNTGDGWFTDGTTVSPPPSGPYLHFRDGVAKVHQERITRISVHNLPTRGAVIWKVRGSGGRDMGTWTSTAVDGSDSQWLAAPPHMEPGMYTVEVVASTDPEADAVAWAAFEVLPAADAPGHPYDVSLSGGRVQRGDVVTATVRGGGIHAGLIPVNPVTGRSVSADLSEPDEIGRRTADLDTAGLPAGHDVFYVAVHDGRTWHLTGTELSVVDP
ncbi:hypothetical protein [Myceligenerans salitolerans]|uniref:Uncharacterized protein n=1 Tax=Myceligenerans salitolerans TaxID=1230528 RepID=A0ABS3I792_9MICO|nr:hypothetical protein [Myceligenerans salitolerans]MBO0608279.1 hypothetical protein [Myceligenerans salitolerans]